MSTVAAFRRCPSVDKHSRNRDRLPIPVGTWASVWEPCGSRAKGYLALSCSTARGVRGAGRESRDVEPVCLGGVMLAIAVALAGLAATIVWWERADHAG